MTTSPTRRRLLLGATCAVLFSAATKQLVARAGAADPDLKTVKVTANGLHFNVKCWGHQDGRPILLLHGFPQTADAFNAVAAGLAMDGHYVVVPWQRGTTPETVVDDRNAYRFDCYVADALAITNSLGIARFDVGGFGLGGAQAWMLAAHSPERLRSLIALRFPHPAAFAQGYEGDSKQRQAWNQHQRSFSDNTDQDVSSMLDHHAAKLKAFLIHSGAPTDVADRYADRLVQPGMLRSMLWWEQNLNMKELSMVPPIRVPTLFVWNEGPALSPAVARATRSFVDAPYNEVELATHSNWILETQSPDILYAIRKHLAAT